MVLTDIVTEFGAFYRNNGQNMDNLYRLAYAQTDTTKFMTPVVVDGTQWQAAQVTIGQVLQPFHKNFTPTSGPTFTPLTINLYHHKLDLLEYPDDLEASWLGFLSTEDVKRTDWPFVRWLLEKMLIPKFGRDYELNEIYKGVYAAPNGSAAGAAGTAMNGIGKVIADQIIAGNISPITTGALSTTPQTFVEQVEAVVDGIVSVNEDYAKIPMNIFMSPALETRYRRGFRAKYGVQTDFEGVTNSVQDTNFKIVGLSSMIGSSRIFATTKENFVDLKYKKVRDGKFDIQGVDRSVKILGDVWRGAGFILPQVVFCNEQV